MAKHPSEIFGYPIHASGVGVERDRKRRRCPFDGEKCNKKSRLIPYPMGVCSVKYGKDTIALCPRRFLQQHLVFKHIANHYFNTTKDLLLFSEVRLPTIGTFDYVLVRHEPISSRIQDFAVVEFQTAQTTNTGQLVKALKDFFACKEIQGKSYSFGLNFADIWKRSFTQILNKGIVLEHWGHKIYWVVQERVYKDLVRRYSLGALSYNADHTSVFMIYDLRCRGGGYELFPTRVESATTDQLFDAFKNSEHIPSKDDFIAKLESKVCAEVALKLRIE